MILTIRQDRDRRTPNRDSARGSAARIPPASGRERSSASRGWSPARSASSTARNPRIGGDSRSRDRTSALGASGVPRSNHSSKSSVNGSSTRRTSSRPAEPKRSTIAPGVRFRVWVRSRSRSMALWRSASVGVGIGRVVAQDDDPAGPDQLHLATDERRGVGDVVQDVSRDRGVERPAGDGVIQRLTMECGPVAEPGASGPGPGDHLLGEVDAHHPMAPPPGGRARPGRGRSRRRGPCESAGRSAARTRRSSAAGSVCTGAFSNRAAWPSKASARSRS